MREYTLTRFDDVVGINAFVARRPDRARLMYEVVQTSGLWRLTFVDLEGEERTLYTVGHYIDGAEDREVVYDFVIKRVWGGYVHEELDEKLHYPPYVVQKAGGFILVTLPYEYKEELVIEAPHVCWRTDPLHESVYIWRGSTYSVNVLDCGSDLYRFKTVEEFERWVRGKVCPEERELIHWVDWYVLPNVREDESWSSVIRRAVRGRYYPSPDDVIALVHKLTEEGGI
jgi:hypothetical protein